MAEDQQALEAKENGGKLEELPQKAGAGAVMGMKVLTGVLLLMAFALAVVPFQWGMKEGYVPDDSKVTPWLSWMGDMHVLVLHLPIGIFFYVAAMEFFGLLSFRKFRPNLSGALFLCAMTAVVAVVFGYFYFLKGDYGAAKLEWTSKMGMHMWFSILFAILTILAFLAKAWARVGGKGNIFYPILMMLSAAALGYGAHNGGELVHRDKDIIGDFEELTGLDLPALPGEHEDEKEDEKEPELVEVKLDFSDIPVEERLAYEQVVRPILVGKCWECHAGPGLNPVFPVKGKVKAKLLMTTVEELVAGGSGMPDFPTLLPGDADSSEMIIRVELDPDDDDFLPKGAEDEPHLHITDGESQVMRWWIDNLSADDLTDRKVKAIPGFEEVVEEIAAIVPIYREAKEDVGAAKTDEVAVVEPEVEEPKVDEELVKLEEARAVVEAGMPGALTFVSRGSKEFTFTGASLGKELTDERLTELLPVAAAIVDLDIKKTGVTDAGLKTVGEMINLKKLSLNDTAISDAGLKELGALGGLESLSLFGTQVGDEGLKALVPLGGLKRLYLGNTQATQAGVDGLRNELPGAEIFYEAPVLEVVPALPEKVPPVEEEKPQPAVQPELAPEESKPVEKPVEAAKVEELPVPAPVAEEKQELPKPVPAEKPEAEPVVEKEVATESEVKKAGSAPEPEAVEKLVEEEKKELPKPTPPKSAAPKPAVKSDVQQKRPVEKPKEVSQPVEIPKPEEAEKKELPKPSVERPKAAEPPKVEEPASDQPQVEKPQVEDSEVKKAKVPEMKKAIEKVEASESEVEKAATKAAAELEKAALEAIEKAKQ